MTPPKSFSPGWLLLGTTALVLTASGCGDGIARYPVSGQVMVDGKPLLGKTGSVLFKPDVSKGNTSPLDAGGRIDGEGNYTLLTGGKKGAPPGWYKVILTASDPGVEREVVTTQRRPFHPKYCTEKTTPLAVEVVTYAEPGAYDLKLTAK